MSATEVKSLEKAIEYALRVGTTMDDLMILTHGNPGVKHPPIQTIYGDIPMYGTTYLAQGQHYLCIKSRIGWGVRYK